MEIVIAKDHNGKIIGIVAAKSKELATAYFHGAKVKYNTIETLKELQVEDGLEMSVSGVIPILKTGTILWPSQLASGTVIVK